MTSLPLVTMSTPTEPYMPNEQYLRWMEEYYQECKRREIYSIARLDLLQVTISGAGLYIVLETLRFLLKEPALLPTWPLKLAGMLFALAITANFISQWTGRETNRLAGKWAQLEYLSEKKGKGEAERDATDAQAMHYSLWTRRMNRTSTALMLGGGLSLLLVYLLHA